MSGAHSHSPYLYVFDDPVMMIKRKANSEMISRPEERFDSGGAVKSSLGWKNNRSSFGNLLLHIHPRSLPERNLKFSHTWGLGGAALMLVLLQAFTGILLLFVFQPVPEKAYDSVRTLMDQVLFGSFIRNMHYWSANLLVVVVLLHMLRVFYTDAFHAPRRFNWVVGLCLFGFVLISNFTGYLLPWDQLSYWAVTISTGMLEYMPLFGTTLQNFIRGGTEMGPATLSNFFVFHMVVMPVCFLLFLPFHFWRIRKDGGVVRPRAAGTEAAPSVRMAPAMPDLVIREISLGLVVAAVIFLLAAFFDAPLGDSANPGLSPNPTKAPWYFMGLQELMLHFHPLFAVFIIPLVLTGLLIYLPYFRYDSDMSGIWFRSGKGRRSAIAAALAALMITPVWILADEYFLDFESWFPNLPPAVSNGLLPVGFIAIILAGGYRLVRKKYSNTNNEAIQALFVFLLVALMVLTAFGIWLRGEGMVLGF